MSESVYALTEEDTVILRSIIDEVKKRRLNPTLRTNTLEDDHQAPEVYLAQVPSGQSLPSLMPGTSPDPDSPGSLPCDIYKLYIDQSDPMNPKPTLLKMEGFQRIIYNLSASPVSPGQWMLAVRDKFGNWFVPDKGGSSVVAIDDNSGFAGGANDDGYYSGMLLSPSQAKDQAGSGSPPHGGTPVWVWMLNGAGSAPRTTSYEQMLAIPLGVSANPSVSGHPQGKRPVYLCFYEQFTVVNTGTDSHGAHSPLNPIAQVDVREIDFRYPYLTVQFVAPGRVEVISGNDPYCPQVPGIVFTDIPVSNSPTHVLGYAGGCLVKVPVSSC